MTIQFKISVAIPTYHREHVLVNTVREILEKQTHKEFELLVIDQSERHDPETQIFLRSIDDPRYRYFRITPPSLTAARNFALRKARSPYIIFLDDDVEPDPNLIATFLETFKNKPDLSAIAGRVLQEGFPVKKEVLKFDKYAISHGVFTATQPGYTNAFQGCNCALRVKDAIAIGGFDTRYKGNAFREESDLSLRLANAGYHIYYQPKAKLLHLAAPYGGLRVNTHVFDNPSFYRNELFFTLRYAHNGHLIGALWRKYCEYCFVVRPFRSCRRQLLFFAGIVGAIWRIIFGKQINARELQDLN